MIYFWRKPDANFSGILNDALRAAAALIGELLRGGDACDWDLYFPLSSRHFTAALAFSTIQDLRTISAASAVYRVRDYHWLLLYELLRIYCDQRNEEIDHGAGPSRSGGCRLDFDELVATYFWDTDFLLPADRFGEVGEEGLHALGLTADVLGLDLERARPDQLRGEEISNPLW